MDLVERISAGYLDKQSFAVGERTVTGINTLRLGYLRGQQSLSSFEQRGCDEP